MSRVPYGRRARSVLAGLTLHALFLFASPFAHHDVVCHLKTPQHCASCTASPLGAAPAAPAPVGSWLLADAGCALTALPSISGALLTVRSTGRSPPFHS